MAHPIVFMYSGQGAQYFHMGAELYAENPTFRFWMDRCSAIVQARLGVALTDVIYDPNAKKFDPFEDTLITHPANVAFAYSLTQTLYEMDITPDYLMGYSLGEYICAIVAEVLSLEEGLDLVASQAQKLAEKTEPAGMMAILTERDIMDRETELFQDTWLSGDNFPGHFVITARRPKLEEIENQLSQRGISSQILPISHGFHSPIVDPIEPDCLAIPASNQTPLVPVISSRTTEENEDFSGKHLWSVLRGTVLFHETLLKFDQRGPFDYVDVGPAGTLSTFVRYGLDKNSSSQAITTVNQFGKDLLGLEKCEQTLS